MSAEVSARIGMVNFINTAALYEVWKETVHRADWLVVEAAPAELNRLLYEGNLDLGFVSSHEYAEHPDRYQLLPDLSISSTGAVGSVFLFSNVAPHLLTGEVVCLSAQSKTSNELIKIILEDFFGVRPSYHLPIRVGSVTEGRAVLAIGDQALRLKSQGRFPFVLDLGEVWQQHTGLPFVFAVWAVREEFCCQQAQCLGEIHQELKRCIRLGRERLPEISCRVAARVPMGEVECLAYLQGIELDFGPDKMQGLSLFYEHLIRRGEASPQALPVKITTRLSNLAA
ncbi:MAG: menaquinone biosynthesis protein [Desulfobulbaceae bacterium]|nr:menaquinone biosynthesis protein [Desulfobulbaceae bacterium]